MQKINVFCPINKTITSETIFVSFNKVFFLIKSKQNKDCSVLENKAVELNVIFSCLFASSIHCRCSKTYSSTFRCGVEGSAVLGCLNLSRFSMV